jgi:hypothetical protein
MSKNKYIFQHQTSPQSLLETSKIKTLALIGLHPHQTKEPSSMYLLPERKKKKKKMKRFISLAFFLCAVELFRFRSCLTTYKQMIGIARQILKSATAQKRKDRKDTERCKQDTVE